MRDVYRRRRAAMYLSIASSGAHGVHTVTPEESVFPSYRCGPNWNHWLHAGQRRKTLPSLISMSGIVNLPKRYEEVRHESAIVRKFLTLWRARF
ncbi:hypothetical protein NKH37_15725 [Mesorhizobium sp. M1217]|uniref:hypothetical protein n=1 Tax=Mesorhizobium sp. M1217 TaxID=2957070 RepID=UPI0033389952